MGARELSSTEKHQGDLFQTSTACAGTGAKRDYSRGRWDKNERQEYSEVTRNQTRKQETDTRGRDQTWGGVPPAEVLLKGHCLCSNCVRACVPACVRASRTVSCSVCPLLRLCWMWMFTCSFGCLTLSLSLSLSFFLVWAVRMTNILHIFFSYRKRKNNEKSHQSITVWENYIRVFLHVILHLL